jgi:hypothetical protein
MVGTLYDKMSIGGEHNCEGNQAYWTNHIFPICIQLNIFDVDTIGTVTSLKIRHKGHDQHLQTTILKTETL